ncbi:MULTISPECIES: hypothetical protein [unclassified Bacillus (in: firmicutes)]|uniref:hypothetical protein n=1 Tax=unclassified Bacillus (in: firmicutes) TaxID=185979 RepID=UPI000E358AB2|nr:MULTISPECIES: hypothetical protein [unclassified Bacillus (in: firmicutes)]AXR14814.1 hypothetical protein DOS87_01080 [Bacillus sp. CR71]AXR20550.1 hypothetical protein DPQ26_01090 [Bacillus sp. E25]
MKNPFYSRRKFRCIAVVCIFAFTQALILNCGLHFLVFVPYIILFCSPVYFIFKCKKEKNKCVELVCNQYNQERFAEMEVYHPNLEWGFLVLTKQALFFVPKKGGIWSINLDEISRYGMDGIGTGVFNSTTSSLTGDTTTREDVNRIFYVYKGKECYYWYTNKNELMFENMQILFGTHTSQLKSNY